MKTRAWRMDGAIGEGGCRGFALFLGVFALLNVAGRRWLELPDANLWWIDLRAMPAGIADGAIVVAAILWVGYGLRPGMGMLRRRLTGIITGVFASVAVVNAALFWRLMWERAIFPGVPVPLSLGVGAGLAWLAWRVWRGVDIVQWTGSDRVGWGVVAAGTMLWVVVFPLAQGVCFGKTDYRRRAASAVVFGARVYADGRLSEAVADRVRTAAQLYREGWVGELVMSGGPGDGVIHETDAMRRMAVRLGVPEEVVRVDREGLNTAATVRNTVGGAAGQTVLAVSEFYHLPRIKLAYAFAGKEVYTVPARPLHWQRQWPARSMAREIPAFWAYYGRGLIEGASGRMTM